MAEVHEALPFESTIDVVLLRTAGGQTVPVTGGVAFNLDDDAEPTGKLLADLLAATVRIRGDEGTSPEVLARLRRIPVPAAFLASQWLDASRAVVLRNGIGHVNGLTVRYSNDGGLRIDLPATGADIDTDRTSDFDDDS